jgi:ABC-2 type transport system permease protein
VYGGETQRGIPVWTFGESLLVVGCFIALQSVLDSVINPSLTAVIDHIRTGTLDFVLLKPADSQFLVSTSQFQFWRFSGLLHATIVFGVAYHDIGKAPSPEALVLALLLLVASSTFLYALWLMIVSAAFLVVKVDNLTSLFTSIFDAARWPSTVFKGAIRFVFTFVIPLTVMTTFPAEALLGRLPLSTGSLSMLGAAVFLLAARTVWMRSLWHYTSAGRKRAQHVSSTVSAFSCSRIEVHRLVERLKRPKRNHCTSDRRSHQPNGCLPELGSSDNASSQVLFDSGFDAQFVYPRLPGVLGTKHS